MDQKPIESRYQQIAFDIAKRIFSGYPKEGEKLSGRSLLSSEYNVSSETIRKAMGLLSNYAIVEVKEKSGIYVLSKEAANTYIQQYKKQQASYKLYQDTQKLLEAANKINHELHKHMKTILNTSKSDIFPFNYFTFKLDNHHAYLGQNIASLLFYDQTGGQIFAVEVHDVLNQVPNPNMRIEAGMMLYILGDQEVERKTKIFFKMNKTI